MPRAANFNAAEQLIQDGRCFDIVEALVLLDSTEKFNKEVLSGQAFGWRFQQLSLDDWRA